MFNVYFRNSHVSIYFDKKWRLGKAVWSGHVRGPEYREAALLCLDLIDRHELTGWLDDSCKMSSLEPADLQWSINVLMPQIMASALLRLASVPSEYEGGRGAVGVVPEKKSKTDEQLLIRSFDREDEALLWLMEPQQVFR